MQTKEHWDISVFQNSPIILQLKSFTNFFKNYTQWPTIDNYLDVFNIYDLNIRPVAQSEVISCFEEQYEPRVYLKKELQTRTHNWHDFFNALIWLKFPETKKTLNKLHYNQAINRAGGSNRSTLENRITQFDECGAVVISNNKKSLELIRNHQWQELFVNQRDQFDENIRCIIFGHAIFEKALKPYIGMTCHCLLIEDHELLESVKQGDNKNLDRKLSYIWLNKMSHTPDKFNALPLLGVPGYWPEQNQKFYSNPKYFR